MSLLVPASLASHQAGVLHRRQLAAAGWSDTAIRRRVTSGDLIAVDDHVFLLASAPPTFARRLWVELQLAAPGSLIGLRSASQLHHVGRFTNDKVDVVEAEPTFHDPRAQGVRRSNLILPSHRTVVDGIPVTSLPRTLFDLCGLVSPKRRRRDLSYATEAQVARTMDDALARGTSLGALQVVLDELAGRGRAGTVLFRRLLQERTGVCGISESELEDLLWQVLSDRGAPLPDRQVDLGGDAAPIGRVDAVYRPERVVVEADGREHHTSLMDSEADRWRDLALAAKGFVVVRVTSRQLLREPDRFVHSLLELLEHRRPAP